MVDAACAECAGISKFPSIRAGLDGSSFGGASRGATYAQMVSPKHDINGMCSHLREECSGIKSKFSLVKCSTVPERSSRQAV